MRQSTQGYLVALHETICGMCSANCNGFDLRCMYHFICMASILANKEGKLHEGD